MEESFVQNFFNGREITFFFSELKEARTFEVKKVVLKG